MAAEDLGNEFLRIIVRGRPSWLLFIDGWAWVLDSTSIYLFPNAPLPFLKVVFAAELIFMVWLLGWGWRIREPSFLTEVAQ